MLTTQGDFIVIIPYTRMVYPSSIWFGDILKAKWQMCFLCLPACLMKPYSGNRCVTDNFFTHYEKVKAKLLSSALQVQFLANWNMSGTSPSYQADKYLDSAHT
jgi:hypothetical protein